MLDQHSYKLISDELEKGMALAKCQQCGCMAETLTQLAGLLTTLQMPEMTILAECLAIWNIQMQPVKYSCLGCAHCYPAVAQNALLANFPDAGLVAQSCGFTVNDGWPPVAGEYFVVDKTAPVAVSTLATVTLATDLAAQKPTGLAIVGKTETENIGLDKIIKNIVTRPNIHYLLVAGEEPAGHFSGQTLLALARNGIDAKKRVIGSPGKRPVLQNVLPAEIDAFRQQVQVIDMIGCLDPVEVTARIVELAGQVRPTGSSCSCGSCAGEIPSIAISTIPVLPVVEPDPQAITLDKAGYFVILPVAERGLINVEHYAYNHTLMHVLEGTTARGLYSTIIANGWITELSHAAYLGKELAKAELALRYGLSYVQDGA